MGKEAEYNTGITRFIEEIATTSLSGKASEMRAQLEAYTKVRAALSELRPVGVRIFELPDFVERYEFARAKKEYRPAELDFILRIENVELQIDVKYRPAKKIFLTQEDLQRYQQILALSAKTQEILIVWANGDLPTLAVNLSKIQKYLSSMKGERWFIQANLLQPLPDAIRAAFDRHMPVWIKPTEISVVKGLQYDVRELFRKALRAKIKGLKATSELRRYPDRKQVIESITDSDIKLLEQIFDASRAKEISMEYIETKLKR